MSETTPAASLLRELRQRREMSLRGAARDLGVAPSQLSRAERGERGLNEKLTERVASYYGVSPDVVMAAEGRLPDDIAQILRKHPELFERIREWADKAEHSGGKG